MITVTKRTKHNVIKRVAINPKFIKTIDTHKGDTIISIYNGYNVWCLETFDEVIQSIADYNEGT